LRVADALVPKIRAGAALEEEELLLALCEQACFDALHAKYARTNPP
jgi:hypothetical protein